MARLGQSTAHVPEPPSLVVAARAVAWPAIPDRSALVAAHADVAQRAVVQGVEEVDGCPPRPPLPVGAPGPGDTAAGPSCQSRRIWLCGRNRMCTRHEPLLSTVPARAGVWL